MNHLRVTIETLASCGVSHREIARRTGVDRKTIRRHVRQSNSSGVATGSDVIVVENPPPRPPAPGAVTITPSACELNRPGFPGDPIT